MCLIWLQPHLPITHKVHNLNNKSLWQAISIKTKLVLFNVWYTLPYDPNQIPKIIFKWILGGMHQAVNNPSFQTGLGRWVDTHNLLPNRLSSLVPVSNIFLRLLYNKWFLMYSKLTLWMTSSSSWGALGEIERFIKFINIRKGKSIILIDCSMTLF